VIGNPVPDDPSRYPAPGIGPDPVRGAGARYLTPGTRHRIPITSSLRHFVTSPLLSGQQDLDGILPQACRAWKPIAPMPYRPTALLPYCLIALLPHCLTPNYRIRPPILTDRRKAVIVPVGKGPRLVAPVAQRDRILFAFANVPSGASKTWGSADPCGSSCFPTSTGR
jgi:hypothetical protein